MPSSGSGDCHRFNLIDLPVARLGLRIVRTDVANTSLKIATLTQHFRELSHSRRYPIQTSGFSIREHDINCCHDIANDRRYCFGFDPSIPAYTELFDCAASIMTHAQHQPPLLVGAVAYDLFSKSNGTTFRQTKVGFIAMNRILHPYFTDSSVTTDFLLEAITYQAKRCQLNSQGSIDIMGLRANKNQLSSLFSLFIDKFSEAWSWNPIQQPLPLTPNVDSETLLATLLKLYAIRVDVTLFFKRLWTPVLPSIISTISMPVVDCSSAFKSLIKVATRLLSHTFSEKSMMLLPVTATAVSQALYALTGIEGLRTYLFDLLILPNLVKILSLADDDCAGANVLYQCNACYDRSNWWPEHKNEVHNPVRSLVWIVWRLYSGAVGITGQALSTVSAESFFCDDPSIDSSSMSDQRLQNLLFTISRSVARSIELIVRLPLDVNKCRLFETMREKNSEKSEVFAALSTANALNRRLSIVTPKPAEMLQLLVISRYEVSAFFDAVIGSFNAEVTRGERVIASEESIKFLRERITRYKILENMIQRNVPLASQRVSEQMMLKLYNVHHSDNGGVDNQDIKTAHHQLLNGIELADSYEAVLLDRLQCLHGKTKSKSKLCDLLGPHYISAALCPSEISAHNTHTPISDNYQYIERNTFSDILMRKGKLSTRSAELSQATTESFVLKIIPTHRGVIHAVRPLERAQESQAEYEEIARKKAERLMVYLRNSQATSTCTGSRYTKVDGRLVKSNLLQDTESRKHYVYASSRHKAGAGAGAGSDLYYEDDCIDNMAYSSSPITRSERRSKAQGSSTGSTPSPATKNINRENVFNGRSMQHPLTESKAQPFPEYLRYKIHRKEEQQEMHEQEQSHYHVRRQESLIKEKEEEKEVEAEKDEVVMCNQYDAHHLHSHGHQQQKATMKYPSRDLGLQTRSPLKGTTDLKGIKTECLNKPVCAHSHTEQIYRDGSSITRINGPLKERIQYNGARNEKHVNRYELFSQLHDSTYVGINFENKSDRNKFGKGGEVARDGDVGLGDLNGNFLNLNPANIPLSYCSDKQSSPRGGLAVAIDSIYTYDGEVSDKNQSRKYSTLVPGSKLGSDSLIPGNFMSASLSSYKIADTLRGSGRGRGRESPSERSLRCKSAGSIPEPLYKPTSHKSSTRSVSPRRQDGYSVTQGHYMGHTCKRGDVPGALSEPTVHLYRHPQALSPSLVQPPFRPTGCGGGPSPSPVLINESYGDSREEYRFCTRDLSPSGDGILFLKAVRRKNSNEQERIVRSAARERLFKPTRPIGDRLCGARPVFKYKESPSTLSDAPSSRFLRDINEGVTPNLREYKETNNSSIRCVFKPLGGSCDIPIPLQEYDQRIKGALSSSSHPHPYPLLGDKRDLGSHCPQKSFLNIEMRHPSPPTCITSPSPSSPPYFEALTESISAVDTDFEVNTGHNDDVADDTEDSFGTSNPPRQY